MNHLRSHAMWRNSSGVYFLPGIMTYLSASIQNVMPICSPGPRVRGESFEHLHAAHVLRLGAPRSAHLVPQRRRSREMELARSVDARDGRSGSEANGGSSRRRNRLVDVHAHIYVVILDGAAA